MTVSNIANTHSTIDRLLAATDVTVPAQFEAAAPNPAVRKFCGLPADLLDIEEPVALATIAALYSSPDVQGADNKNLNSEHTLSVRLLALYAAGASIRFTKESLRLLFDRTPVGSKQGNEAFEFACNMMGITVETESEFIRFVRNCALFRGLHDGVIAGLDKPAERTEGLALVDIESGRGYGVIDSGLPADFHESRQFSREQQDQEVRYIRQRLLTYAALFSAARPRCCNRHAEAIVMLALYGAGARIALSKQQFRKLEKRAKQYIGQMSSEHFQQLPNAEMARYALRRASARAKWSGVI